MSINFSNLSKKIEFVHFSKISRGNGKELKYIVKDKDMNRYLFKINSIIKLNNKVNEFRFAKRIEHLPFEKSEIVDLCVFDSNRYICSIYKWIDGKILEDQIKNYPISKQYSLGFKAGKTLNLIHNLPIRDEEQKQATQLPLREIMEYYHQNKRFENDNLIIDFILKNHPKIKNEKICFLHGHYSIKNFIIRNNDEPCLIDYNQCYFGDYVQDFSKNEIYNSYYSEQFAQGLIEGYFYNRKIPEYFWLKYAYYTAYNCITLFLWASKQEVISTRIKVKEMIQNVLNQFNNFESVVPNWYKKNVQNKERQKFINSPYTLEKILGNSKKENESDYKTRYFEESFDQDNHDLLDEKMLDSFKEFLKNAAKK